MRGAQRRAQTRAVRFSRETRARRRRQADRGLQIAISAGRGAGGARTGTCTLLRARRSRSDRWFTRGSLCDEHDITTYSTCLRGERTAPGDDRTVGRVGGAEPVAARPGRCITGQPDQSAHEPRPGQDASRRRREPGRAWTRPRAPPTDHRRHRWILTARLARAEGYWLESQPELARREAELADDVADSGDAWERGTVAVWLRRCGSTGRREASWPNHASARSRATGEGRSAVDRPGLPLRGGAGPARHGGGATAARGPDHLHRPGRVGRGPDHPAEDAPARHQVDPGRPADGHPSRIRWA